MGVNKICFHCGRLNLGDGSCCEWCGQLLEFARSQVIIKDVSVNKVVMDEWLVTEIIQRTKRVKAVGMDDAIKAAQEGASWTWKRISVEASEVEPH